MTRINCGIPVQNLNRKHLLAEHREIKRIPNLIKKGKYNLKGKPDEFTLNKGHVKFFYDKLKYLHLRYKSLYKECLRRGYEVQSFEESFENLPKELYNMYKPSPKDSLILKIRIKEKLHNQLEKERVKFSKIKIRAIGN